jgi:TRAP transporter TAXI family solute receptor
MKKLNMAVAVAFCFTLFAAGAPVFAGGSPEGGKGGTKNVQLEWASGSIGGAWYVISAGLAQLIEEQAPNIKIRVVPGAGTQNSITVGENKTEIGFGMPTLVMDASRGRAPFEKKYEDIRGIANGFSFNYYHFIAAEETGVKTFQDFLKSPERIRIDVTKKGASGEDVFNKILTGYLKSSYEAFEAKGAKFSFNEYTTIAINMKDKHIDFTGVNIIPPSSLVQELAAGRKIRVISLPEDVRAYMNKEHGYGLGVIKKEVYPGLLTEDIKTITTGTMAMCHKSLDDETVYAITKILCENPERLMNIDKGLKEFSAAEACKDMPVPLHPGAERYYREKGYLK